MAGGFHRRQGVSLFLSICALGFLAAAAVPAWGVTVSIPASSAAAGSSVEIPVNVSDATGIAGFQFTVTFNSAVLQPTGAVAGSLTSGWWIVPNYATSGQMTVVGADFTLTGLSSGTGSLVKLRFNVIGTSGQTTTFAFTEAKLNDKFAQDILPVSTSGGTFTVNPSGTTYSVGGTITYAGGQTGTIYVGLFSSNNYNVAPVKSTTVGAPGAYSITGVVPGTYYLAAFRDSNANTNYDVTVDAGGEHGANPLTVSSANLTAKDVTLYDPPVARTVSAEDTEGGSNSWSNIPITITDARGIAEFQFVCTFSSSVFAETAVVRGDLLPPDWVVDITPAAGGATLFGKGISPLTSGAGTLVYLRLKTKPGLGVGTTDTIDFTTGDCYLKDEAGSAIAGVGYDEGTFTVSQETFTFNLVTTAGTDVNAISLALDNTGITTAEQLAQAVPNCDSVSRWDAATQLYVSHPKGAPFNNFALTVGSAYFVNVTAATPFQLTGTTPTVSFSLITTAGTDVNAISLPFSQSAITTAEQLAQAVPNCDSVSRWDAATQLYVSHPKGAPFNNFATQVGYPYFVNVTANTTWP